MKKRILYIALFTISIFISMNSCSNPKVNTANIYNITSQDTTDMLNLASACMDTLKNGHVETALNMMYITRNDTLMPMSNEQKARMTKKFQRFPILEYTIESFKFSQYKGNEVKFRVKFAEGNETENLPAAYTGMKFNPIKYGTDWYLTIENE